MAPVESHSAEQDPVVYRGWLIRIFVSPQGYFIQCCNHEGCSSTLGPYPNTEVALQAARAWADSHPR